METVKENKQSKRMSAGSDSVIDLIPPKIHSGIN